MVNNKYFLSNCVKNNASISIELNLDYYSIVDWNLKKQNKATLNNIEMQI